MLFKKIFLKSFNCISFLLFKFFQLSLLPFGDSFASANANNALSVTQSSYLLLAQWTAATVKLLGTQLSCFAILDLKMASKCSTL